MLYGREKEIEENVNQILVAVAAPLSILGAGGIGKTALALVIMEHADVVRKYESARFFVRCEQATSAALLIELLARGLGVKVSSDDRMKDVMAVLRSSHLVLIILDNFETPWDSQGEQSRVEEILYSIASLSHVTILITMRSNVPPSVHLRWSPPHLLSALPKQAARDLYLEIDPAAGTDSSLDMLLDDLSYMPLAVGIMASLSRNGERPTDLLQSWRDKAVGTDLLHGPDKNKSVKISIQLSIESNMMRALPDALTLLSVVAMLPAGANIALLPKLVTNIPNLLRAKATLRQATLTHAANDSQTIQLLSPVRSYVLKHHPASDSIKQAVYGAYADFVAEHNSKMAAPLS